MGNLLLLALALLGTPLVYITDDEDKEYFWMYTILCALPSAILSVGCLLRLI